MLLKEYILFISCFHFYQYIFILAVFNTVSRRYKKDNLHASIDILFHIMFYIINPMKKTLLYHVRTYNTKRSRFEPGHPSPLFITTPLQLARY